MWTIVKLYWQPITAAAAAFVLSFAIGMTLHNLDVYRLKAKYDKKITAQIAADTAKCNADKKITEDVNHDYEDAINALNHQLDALRLLDLPAKCVPISPVQTDSGNGSTAGSVLPGSNGISSQWLIGFAGRAEKVRLQLKACQAFVNKTWAEQ